MRHCANEHVDVYEADGDNIADLLHMAGTQLDKLEGEYGHVSVSLGLGVDTMYIITLYVH